MCNPEWSQDGSILSRDVGVREDGPLPQSGRPPRCRAWPLSPRFDLSSRSLDKKVYMDNSPITNMATGRNGDPSSLDNRNDPRRTSP
jgi:hypothetical protein